MVTTNPRATIFKGFIYINKTMVSVFKRFIQRNLLNLLTVGIPQMFLKSLFFIFYFSLLTPKERESIINILEGLAGLDIDFPH